MPRYFFSLRHKPGTDGLAVDLEGDELADIAAAREHALSEARGMIARDRFEIIRDWMVCAFEITDEAGGHVMTVPFSDTVQEADEDTED